MSMKREGTMQKTAREADEFGYGCDCGDEEHDHGEEETNGDVPSTKRQSTMQLTAQEGVEYLKSQGKDSLLEAQGLAPPVGDDNGEDDDDDDEDEDEDDDEDEAENGEKNGKKPHVKKTRTMAATAAEGEVLLDYMGGKPDPEARTRAQQKEIEEVDDEDDLPDEPEAKKPRRTQTIQATTEEAKELVGDDLGGSRSETAAVKKAEQEKISPKRASTMQKTVEEGADFLQGSK